MTPPATLPPDTLAALENDTGTILAVTQPPQGENVRVWQIDAERGRFIVKSSGDAAKVDALAREGAVLETLTVYAPLVPGFLARVGDFFLFSYLDGVNLAVVVAEDRNTDTRRHLSQEYGRVLRVIHGWEPPVARPADWFAEAIARADKNAQALGKGSIVAGNCLWDGLPYQAVWQEIVDEKDKITPLVVYCHGDWCLPNVLITNGTATGAVDWGDGGWADYRMDLAMGVWSLRFNCGVLDDDPQLPMYLDAFLAGYGYPDTVGSLRFWEALCLLY